MKYSQIINYCIKTWFSNYWPVWKIKEKVAPIHFFTVYVKAHVPYALLKEKNELFDRWKMIWEASEI